MRSILFAYDEKSLRDFLFIMLEEEGCQVFTASSVEKANKLIRKNDFDLILTDIRMGRSSGVDVLGLALNALPDTPVVIMRTYASAETAVTVINKAAETLNLSFRSMKYGIKKHKLRGNSKNDE